MTLPTHINLPDGFLQRWQTAKDDVNQSVNSLTNSAHQFGQSLQETVNTTTDQTIDAVTTTLQQVKSTTSVAVKTAISASVNDWLLQHPIFLQLVQILGWATNHPIISLIILLFVIALFWNIIKAMMRLIETASWSILQLPLKLIQGLIKVSILSLKQVSSFAMQKIINNQKLDNDLDVTATNTQSIYPHKQQRLAEISLRLEVIQQEQKELLQEAADLIATDKVDLKISDWELSNN